MIKPEQTPKML